MLIHNHSDNAQATTSSHVTIDPRTIDELTRLTPADLLVFSVGWLLLGVIVGWSINRARVAYFKARCERVTQRWLRTSERLEHSKTVIAQMVDQESEGRRQRSVVA